MKTVLITGGTGGIGNNIVKFLFEKNFQIIIWGRTEKKFNTLKNQLTENNLKNLRFEQIDISNESQVKEGIRHLDRLDVLINAAGVVWPIGKITEIDLKKFKEAFEINFYGTLLTCYYAIPLLLKSKKGKIINFSGGGSAYARENHTAYGCSKTAIVRLTENLGIEYPNLDINIISPGAHKTPMWEDETFDKKPEEWADINKLFQLIEFLISEKSSGITGKFLHYKDKIDSMQNDIKQNSDLYTLRRIDNFKFSKLNDQ